MTSIRSASARRLAQGPQSKAQVFQVYTTAPFPNDWPSWRTNLAVGKLPRADGYTSRYTQPQLDKILQHLGFAAKSAGKWVHPDGSEVTTSAGKITGSRFQRWGFGDFPYRVGMHDQQWKIDTQAWTAWLQGTGAAPFPQFAV